MIDLFLLFLWLCISLSILSYAFSLFYYGALGVCWAIISFIRYAVPCSSRFLTPLLEGMTKCLQTPMI